MPSVHQVNSKGWNFSKKNVIELKKGDEVKGNPKKNPMQEKKNISVLNTYYKNVW